MFRPRFASILVGGCLVTLMSCGGSEKPTATKSASASPSPSAVQSSAAEPSTLPGIALEPLVPGDVRSRTACDANLSHIAAHDTGGSEAEQTRYLEELRAAVRAGVIFNDFIELRAFVVTDEKGDTVEDSRKMLAACVDAGWEVSAAEVSPYLPKG